MKRTLKHVYAILLISFIYLNIITTSLIPITIPVQSELVETVLLNDGFEATNWNENWSGNWYRSAYKHSGSYCAAALNGKEGTWTSNTMNTSDAQSITIDLWFMKMEIDSTDYTVYYYDGSSFVIIDELDNNGGDYPTWLHYTHTTTNSRYFTTQFRVRVDTTLDAGEQAWIDDVQVSKIVETQTEQYTLTAGSSGQGTVDLTPQGPYDPGTIVTLTAVPDAGWEFSSWSGYLLGSTSSIETITMTADRWVRANFIESQPPSEQYTLTAGVSGQGSVNLNPTGPYTPGTVVTLTAVPDAGWEFSSWSGYLVGSTNAVETLTMTADRWVQAVFTESQIPPEQYTLTAGVSGQGSVNLNPTGPYDPGTVVTLTAVPDAGWEFSSWSGYLLGSTSSIETITMTADRWVRANFIESQPPSEQYTLTAGVSGQGSVNLNPTGPYTPGTVVTLTAVPDAGWEFSSWSGYLVGSTNAVETITMTADRWVRANFIESPPPSEQYTLTAGVSGQGSVNLNPTGPYTPGTIVTLTAVPAPGWEFSSWSGYLLGSTNAVETITMTADRWVQAVFTESANPSSDNEILTRYRVNSIGDLPLSELVFIAENYDLLVIMPWDINQVAMGTVRSNNPDILILAYENIWAVDDRTSLYEFARSRGWILKDIYGNEVYAKNWPVNKICDVGNPDFQNWLAGRIVTHMTTYGFDGIMADNTRAIVESVYGVNADPVNPRTGQIFTPTEWRDAMINNVRRIRTGIGSRIYIGNGAGSLTGSLPNGFWANQDLVEPLIDEVDGMMLEGFIRWENEGWRTEYAWKQDVNYLAYLGQKGKMSVSLVNIYGNLPAPKDQIMMYGLTSHLLGQSSSNAYFSVSNTEMHDIADECQTNIGSPIESYHKRLDSGLYEREYTNALILVNPTYTSYTINLGRTYTTLTGTTVTWITVSPHTGVILLE